MIVVCPNCSAKYRLSDAALARNARLRCAACDYRWIPESVNAETASEARPVAAPPPPRRITEADEEAAFAAVQEQMLARWQTPATVESPTIAQTGDINNFEPGYAPEDEDEAAARPPGRAAAVIKTLLAGIAGIALSVVAAGLWLGQINLSAVPMMGDFIERMQSSSPLEVTVFGQATLLPSGKRLLEISGRIHNRTDADTLVPPLKATLSGPAGIALRWSIAPPVTSLAPGHEVEFASTVTGFPAEATTLSVRAGH